MTVKKLKGKTDPQSALLLRDAFSCRHWYSTPVDTQISSSNLLLSSFALIQPHMDSSSNLNSYILHARNTMDTAKGLGLIGQV